MHLVSVTTFWFAIVGVCGNYTELSELIQRIHKEYNPAAVYLIGIRSEHLSEISKNDFNIPLAIFTYFPSELSSIDENIILVLQVDSENHQFPEVIEKFIDLLRDRKFVVIIADSLEVLKETFQCIHEKKFRRIFGIVESIPYVYLPYVESSVQRIEKSGPLPDALRDLNGFTFRTTLQTDIPRNFRYKNKQSQWTIGGYVTQLYLSFLQKHNASFTEIFINNSTLVDIPGIFNATTNDEIDISMNAYDIIEGLEYSYPIKYLSWDVMAPLNGFVDSYQYYVRPFTGMVWMCIGLTVVYIIVMDILKDLYANVPIKMWLYISRTFLKLLSMSSEKKITNDYRFHCQVLVFAFILGNLYSIHLTSFLTVFIKIKQYNTIQELIDNNVSLMMPTYHWPSISDPELHTEGLENILVLVDYTTHNDELNSMRNTSFAYSVGSDRAEFLLALQMNFVKPYFHTIDDSLSHFYLTFMLPKYSPFHEILDSCIIQVIDSGLMHKWTLDAVRQVFRSGLVDIKHQDRKLHIPLTWHHLKFAWICLVLGLILATAAFIVEQCARIFNKK